MVLIDDSSLADCAAGRLISHVGPVVAGAAERPSAIASRSGAATAIAPAIAAGSALLVPVVLIIG